MRSNTEKRPGRLAPVLAALATVAVVLIFVGTLLWTFLAAGGMDTIGVGIMAVYVLIGLAVIGGVLAAMVQRLLYPAEGGLLCLVTVFLLYNYTALFHCLLFTLPALAGNLAGSALRRRKPFPGKEDFP